MYDFDKKNLEYFSESELYELDAKIKYFSKTYFFVEGPDLSLIDWYISEIREGRIKIENLEEHFQSSPTHRGALLQKHACVYTKYGTKMYLHENDKYISKDIALHYCWEPEESEFLKNYIKKGMNLVDIGANIGYYTLLFSKWTGDQGKVYAFEPEPENYKLLVKNVKANNCLNVVDSQEAVSNKIGASSFFLAADKNSGDNRLLDSFDFETYYDVEKKSVRPLIRKKIEIHTTTLDSYLPEEQKIDFIKLDIQGSEMMAFEGMTNVINRSDNIAIFFEFWPYAIEKSGFSPKESIKKILNMGFKISKIEKGHKKHLSRDFEMMEKYDEGSQMNLLCEKSKRWW